MSKIVKPQMRGNSELKSAPLSLECASGLDGKWFDGEPIKDIGSFIMSSLFLRLPIA